MAVNQRARIPTNDPDDNRRRALHHLTTAYQFNQHQTAAVMAAIKHESNFNLSVVGDRNLGRGREAHGLFQWREQRYTNMQRFVAARPGQDPVTTQIDFAMHEMGIPRRDNLNVPGPAFGSERQAGDMLKRSSNLGQAVEAMHQFERYDNRSGETNRRQRTAMGFIREVAAAISNTYNRVVDTVSGAFKRVFGSNETPAPAPHAQSPSLRINRISDEPSASHVQPYAQYGVPVRGHEHRPPAQVTPMKRSVVAAVAPHPAPSFTIHRQHDNHPSPPRQPT